MLLAPGQLDEAFHTVETLERSLAGMDALVSLHVGLLDKGLATILTLVLFLLKMDLLMPLPRSHSWELLPTNRAGVS